MLHDFPLRTVWFLDVINQFRNLTRNAYLAIKCQVVPFPSLLLIDRSKDKMSVSLTIQIVGKLLLSSSLFSICNYQTQEIPCQCFQTHEIEDVCHNYNANRTLSKKHRQTQTCTRFSVANMLRKTVPQVYTLMYTSQELSI